MFREPAPPRRVHQRRPLPSMRPTVVATNCRLLHEPVLATVARLHKPFRTYVNPIYKDSWNRFCIPLLTKTIKNRRYISLIYNSPNNDDLRIDFMSFLSVINVIICTSVIDIYFPIIASTRFWFSRL